MDGPSERQAAERAANGRLRRQGSAEASASAWSPRPAASDDGLVAAEDREAVTPWGHVIEQTQDDGAIAGLSAAGPKRRGTWTATTIAKWSSSTMIWSPCSACWNRLATRSGVLKDPAAWPGCLITDQHMPEMTGLELAAHLRSRGFVIPVLLFSGHLFPCTRVPCRRARHQGRGETRARRRIGELRRGDPQDQEQG
jgi:CheY-like chemotaxis protein